MTTRLSDDDCEQVSLRTYEIFFKALTEKDVTIEEYGNDVLKPFPDTPTTLRLPECVRGQSKRGFYRVALAHRSLHHQLGTFNFRLSEMDDKSIREAIRPLGEGAHDLECFFDTFADRELALSIFEALEDARVDSQLPYFFKGLRDPLSNAIRCELDVRPGLATMAPREGALEYLIRKSLSNGTEIVPAQLVSAASDIDTIFGSLDFQRARVEEIAVATIRMYSVVSSLPNLGSMALVQPVLSCPGLAKRSIESIWPSSWPEEKRDRIEGDDIFLLSVPKVLYRGSLEAYVVNSPYAPGPDHQALYRMRDSAYSESAKSDSPILKISGPPEPIPHDHHDVSRHLHKHEEGELTSSGPNTFLYREWDCFLGRYKHNWVRVEQRRPVGGGAAARNSLQARYASELRRLRRVMDLPRYQGFALERRSTSGSDIDYDAAVEAVVNHKVTGNFSDAIYQDMKRQRRDIAVLVLIDVSASTAERVESADPIYLDLSADIEDSHRLRPPRILDIEIVSALLCASALEGVGDIFGIWSFSGTGRESVVLSEVKSFNEPFSGLTTARASGLKPHHATRLGAALRHCGNVLTKVQAETKVLLVVTDGRPYDVDYGASYGDDRAQSYALADSDMALSELLKSAIEPYLLTVDTHGEQYVSAFQNARVEVLKDVKALPEKMVSLYTELLEGRTPSKRDVRRKYRLHQIFQDSMGVSR